MKWITMTSVKIYADGDFTDGWLLADLTYFTFAWSSYEVRDGYEWEYANLYIWTISAGRLSLSSTTE